MTTFAQARVALLEEYVDNTVLASTQVTLENEQYKGPSDTPWVRVSVRHFDGGQGSLGGVGQRKFDRLGSVFVQIFIPQDSGGTDDAETIAHEARTLLEGKSLLGTTVNTLTTNIREVGLLDGYYVMVAETGFEYQETR